MAEKYWDIFISYASEDKDSVARPLAEVLQKAAVRVWLDDYELKLGDSLSGKIDEGLAQSRFGVVILSPAFLRKHWPKKELSGLRAREEEGRKVIIPVWHTINKNYLMKFSPTLADSVAINADVGIKTVATRILDVIFAPDSDSPSLVIPTVLRRLCLLIESHPSKGDLTNFLKMHNRLHDRPDYYEWNRKIVWEPMADRHVVDLCVIHYCTSMGVSDLSFINFVPYWNAPVIVIGDGSLVVAPEVRNALQEMQSFRQWLRESLEVYFYYREGSKRRREEMTVKAHIRQHLYYSLLKEPHKKFFDSLELPHDLPHIYFNRCSFKMYVGRRGDLSQDKQRQRVWETFLRTINEIDVRTYDTLIDRGGTI